MEAICIQFLLPSIMVLLTYIVSIIVLIFARKVSNETIGKVAAYVAIASVVIAMIFNFIEFQSYASFWYWVALFASALPLMWIISIFEPFLRTHRCEYCHRWFTIKSGATGRVRKSEIHSHIDSEGRYHHDKTVAKEYYWRACHCTCKACNARYGWYCEGKGTNDNIIRLAEGEYLPEPEAVQELMKKDREKLL